ncbi:MAG: glycosyltransferase family 2 protein, partial [Candidatus Nanopelagicales bacterium]
EVLRASIDCKTEIKLSEDSERLGYSRAVQNSIKICNTDIFIFMDSDGQYDPKEIPKLLEKLAPKTIVCGYRNPRIDPWQRILYSNLFKVVFYLFFRIKLIDPSSPFIAAYAKDLDFLQNSKIKLDYGFWWEFQARINKQNIKVIEIPVIHRQRLVGKTQVYKITKLPRIIFTHLIGLYMLKKELSKN